MDRKIEIRDLSYSVPAQQILKNISLHVDRGQFVGLIGPNGSGKTTLLKHIYRAIPPRLNCVYINGSAVESYSYRQSARQVTVMKQENSSDFDYTILEMVLMGRTPYRRYYERDTEEDKRIAREALRRVGMEALAHRAFSTLSGGEKQRVLIARSLAQEADILVLDEPTNHLDVHYQWSLIETVAGLGKTILAVFHELNLACRFCDYLYVLQRGCVVLEGTPNEVVTRDMLAGVFGVNADIIDPGTGKPYVIIRESL